MFENIPNTKPNKMPLFVLICVTAARTIWSPTVLGMLHVCTYCSLGIFEWVMGACTNTWNPSFHSCVGTARKSTFVVTTPRMIFHAWELFCRNRNLWLDSSPWLMCVTASPAVKASDLFLQVTFLIGPLFLFQMVYCSHAPMREPCLPGAAAALCHAASC